MQPLPARLTRSEAVELICDVLQAFLTSRLMTDSTAAKDDALAGALGEDAELENLVHSRTFLATERDFALPEPHRVVLEILAILCLESFYRWLHLLPEFKEEMPSEAFAKLGKLFDQPAVELGQLHKDAHGDVLWGLEERFDLLFQRLFQVELFVVYHESLLNVAFLLSQHLLLLLQHLFVDTEVVHLVSYGWKVDLLARAWHQADTLRFTQE